MAILKIDHQIFNLKKGLHLIGSDKGVEIYINSKTIDEKHALLEVSSYGMKIIDLQTKNGTFINGNKIDCVKSIDLPKNCPIQFGYITGDLKLYCENDSGFSEKPTDTSAIIVSSPERNQTTHTFYVHNKHTKTSTPNNDMKFKTEFVSPTTKSTNENVKQIEKDVTNSISHDLIIEDNQNDKSSFFVPETQPIIMNNNLSKLSNSNCNDATKGNNSSSFFVPETQPITENKTNIFSNITDENIRNNIESMSENDEFYIPETQEIFQDNNNLNSQYGGGSLYKISTQDFNATGFLDASSDLSNDSENLFNGIQLSANIPLIKTTKISSTKSNSDKSTKNKINNFTIECEDDYDAELSALKWNETDRNKTNSSAPVSNSTTPDCILNDKDILNDNKTLEKIREDSITPDFITGANATLKNNKTLEQIREDSITPDFILETNNNSNKIENNSITPDLILDADLCDINKKQGSKLENSFKESFKQNICDESQLEPTQVFIKPNVNKKCIEKNIILQANGDNLEPTQIFVKPVKNNNLLQSNNDDLEPTQIFSKNISLSNHSDKENTIDSNKSSSSILDKISDSTEMFISPKNKTINNKKQSSILEIDDSLEPTQPFTREKINHAPDKSAFVNFTLESDDDENSPIKRISNIKRNKLMSSSDEDQDIDELSKFKTPIGSGIKKMNSNCSSDAFSFGILKKNNSLSSTNSSTDLNKQYDNNKLIESNSQNNFDFITCTPQFDFIKPHQSFDIKQAGHLFNNVKSKNNKILLEESSDDDEFDNLLNLLDNKDEKTKKSRKKDIKSDTNKSTKDNNLVTKKETRTTRRKLNLKESTSSEIRKSTRKKTIPNYIIESYIIDNFTESCGSDLEDVKSTTRTSKKRPHNADIQDNQIKSSKIKKTTLQQYNGDKKNSQKKLRDEDVEKNVQKNLELNDHIACHNENGRPTRRCNKKLNHKFVFTIVNASEYHSIIESMGAEIVDNPKDATMLITNGIFRTCKFMVALARGIPIVSNKWLDIITDSPDTSYNKYIINDPVNEKKFKFSLTKTLKLSAKKLIFKNYTFLITPKTTPPPSELIQIIECTGGQYVKEIPKGLIDINTFYVVSDKKDNKIWPKIRKSIPNVNIISTEGILLSVMQHSLQFNDHLLHQKN